MPPNGDDFAVMDADELRSLYYELGIKATNNTITDAERGKLAEVEAALIARRLLDPQFLGVTPRLGMPIELSPSLRRAEVRRQAVAAAWAKDKADKKRQALVAAEIPEGAATFMLDERGRPELSTAEGAMKSELTAAQAVATSIMASKAAFKSEIQRINVALDRIARAMDVDVDAGEEADIRAVERNIDLIHAISAAIEARVEADKTDFTKIPVYDPKTGGQIGINYMPPEDVTGDPHHTVLFPGAAEAEDLKALEKAQKAFSARFDADAASIANRILGKVGGRKTSQEIGVLRGELLTLAGEVASAVGIADFEWVTKQVNLAFGGIGEVDVDPAVVGRVLMDAGIDVVNAQGAPGLGQTARFKGSFGGGVPKVDREAIPPSTRVDDLRDVDVSGIHAAVGEPVGLPREANFDVEVAAIHAAVDEPVGLRRPVQMRQAPEADVRASARYPAGTLPPGSVNIPGMDEVVTGVKTTPISSSIEQAATVFGENGSIHKAGNRLAAAVAKGADPKTVAALLEDFYRIGMIVIGGEEFDPGFDVDAWITSLTGGVVSGDYTMQQARDDIKLTQDRLIEARSKAQTQRNLQQARRTDARMEMQRRREAQSEAITNLNAQQRARDMQMFQMISGMDLPPSGVGATVGGANVIADLVRRAGGIPAEPGAIGGPVQFPSSRGTFDAARQKILETFAQMPVEELIQ